MGEMSDYYGVEDPRWFNDVATDDNVQPPFRDPPQPTKTVWVTRDGQRIKVVDMADSHLVNMIRYLRRMAQAQMMQDLTGLGSYLDGDPPDGAFAAATAAETELLDMDVDDFAAEVTPTFAAMLAEAEKRGLQP